MSSMPTECTRRRGKANLGSRHPPGSHGAPDSVSCRCRDVPNPLGSRWHIFRCAGLPETYGWVLANTRHSGRRRAISIDSSPEIRTPRESGLALATRTPMAASAWLSHRPRMQGAPRGKRHGAPARPTVPLAPCHETLRPAVMLSWYHKVPLGTERSRERQPESLPTFSVPETAIGKVAPCWEA